MATKTKTKKTKEKKLPLNLQVGEQDLITDILWDPSYEWKHMSYDEFAKFSSKNKDYRRISFIWLSDQQISEKIIKNLEKFPPYIFIYSHPQIGKVDEVLKKRKAIHFENESRPAEVANRIGRDLYRGQSGFASRMDEGPFLPTINFEGEIIRRGRFSTIFSDDFGPKFVQVASMRRWKGDIHPGVTNSIWVEYNIEGDVEFELHFDFFDNHSGLIESKVIPMSKMREINNITSPDAFDDYQLSFFAKGKGSLELINVHNRRSRHGIGNLLPGSEWKILENNQELLSYYYPGTIKKPLVVWFAGSRLVVDGFEMMGPLGKHKVPYLLFTDSRSTGGVFDIGDEIYEKAVADRIMEALKEADVEPEDLIIGGYSMGSYPALYYAGYLAKNYGIQPGVVFSGKPILNLGTFTASESRGAIMEWNLEARRFLTGRMDRADTEELDAKLYRMMNYADWTNIQTYLFVMEQDDYDGRSLPYLLAFLKEKQAKFDLKGVPGLHVEKTAEMIEYIDEFLTKEVKKREDK